MKRDIDDPSWVSGVEVSAELAGKPSAYVEDEDARMTMLGPQIFIRTPGHLIIFKQPHERRNVTFRVEMLKQGLRPTSVAVQSRSGAEEVTATDLRAVNVQGLWREHIVANVQRQHRPGHPSASPAEVSDEKLALMRFNGPVEETLKYVAERYMLADSLGLAPAMFVQQSFQGHKLKPLPRTTTSKWIRRARETGLIPRTADPQETSDGDD